VVNTAHFPATGSMMMLAIHFYFQQLFFYSSKIICRRRSMFIGNPARDAGHCLNMNVANHSLLLSKMHLHDHDNNLRI